MFDPASTVTLGQVISNLKDGAFVVGIVVLGWKARGLVQPAIDFFNRAVKHMDVMEQGVGSLQIGMNTLLSNHLSHIEEDLRVLSGRPKSEYIHPLVESVDPLLEK